MAEAEETAGADQDQIIESLRELTLEAKSEFQRFKRKLKEAALNDPAALASAVSDLFSIVTDLCDKTTAAHADHYEWGAQVNEELDALAGDSEGSMLLPPDAFKLKALLADLKNNLREPKADPDDVELLTALKAQVDEATRAIDEMTVETDDETEEAEEPATGKH